MYERRSSLARLFGMSIFSLAVCVMSRSSCCETLNANELGSQKDLIPEITSSGGKQIEGAADPHFGIAVDLRDSESNAPHLDTKLYMKGGTVSFWVRPHWKPNSFDSHTLLSARWNDERHSYFAISEGWWEPVGRGRLYFIASNEDIIHCSSDNRLPTETWSLITVTWASGTVGYCRLYVDDELRASGNRFWPGLSTTDRIELGSDRAATDNRGRTAQASIAGLKVLSHPVTHRNIIQRYRSEENPESLFLKKWAWLQTDPTVDDTRTQSATSQKSNFKRVIFDEDMTWATDKKTIDERLRRIAEAGFDIYVPCVWHGHGSLYPSRTTPPEDWIKQSLSNGWDPLAYLIDRAHALKIAILPWFTVVRREGIAHPEWAETGTPIGAYDVHSPEFRNFAVQMMLDVVTRYDVDGVNLDYIRAMGVFTSTSCQRSYREQTGTELLVDYADGAPNEAAWRKIQSWQDNAVGALVYAFSTKARESKPTLLITVDGDAVPANRQRPLEGRDEISWANNSWIDIFFHMDYRPEVDLTVVNAAHSRLTDPRKLWLLVGNFDTVDGIHEPRSGSWLAKVISFTQNIRRDAGVGVYLYDLLSEEQIESLRIGAPRQSQQADKHNK
jgi:hypothetical protein